MFKKIFKYFTTDDILKGLSIAILLSSFIYFSYINLENKIINTIFGLLGLYLLIGEKNKVWFWSGFFIALLWFWWILLSFRFYDMAWAIPIGTFMVLLVYGFIFWFFAFLSSKLSKTTNIPISIFHAFFIFGFSYIHPFEFDWFKPELVFVDSFIGITKWQFAIVLSAIVLSKISNKLIFLCLVIFAYSGSIVNQKNDEIEKIKLVTTDISVDDKWQEAHQDTMFKIFFAQIDKAIAQKKKIVVFPESVFPLFLNLEPKLLSMLQQKAKKIDMVVGALYWDKHIPRNSTYVFSNNKIMVINKAVLVPFGEANPLPDWLGKYINKIFFKEGVIDYVASDKIINYKLDGKNIRNAICYEATSEKLYRDGPKHMIAISNNGWFLPSTEPTLQKLLLKYYSKKYGTTIYHSINMSPSYIVRNGEVSYVK
ncbi:Apolipoprotein N-acyltransferase [Sulfurovum sp. enrichment culture clone C5]|uniref:Apolipoprotein N-acyltransferase n=1 Tax=Sulfurovum sp. enrichment culture clone C5 TaxID=497650 RepID=A0A0S4XLR4_9BACT|nr:Apolipoprotein N-acyltransferase [Sulfurovum sp. enrichment culture clone C5]